MEQGGEQSTKRLKGVGGQPIGIDTGKMSESGVNKPSIAGLYENLVKSTSNQYHRPTREHRWELPVGNYHGNSGNYHYPFFWVIFMVILHDFIFKNYHENQSDCYPFS